MSGSEFKINRYSAQIVTTGRPQVQNPLPQSGQSSFEEVLRKKMEQAGGPVFSKHATARAQQRGVDLSDTNVERLSEGMRIAGQKGLNDTLILVDGTAFLVSVSKNRVITAVSGDDLKGNVFTNIDGTVII